MKKLFVCLIFLFTVSAFALELKEARAKGLVGELPNGYVAAVDKAANADVVKLVNEINSKRKQSYEDVAKNSKAELKIVEEQAAKKILDTSLQTGDFYKTDINGAWLKK